MDKNSLLQCVDCIELYADNWDAGISYYKNTMGLKLLWRSDTTAGLGMEKDTTEVVINTQRPGVCGF